MANLYLGLVHYPIYNKHRETICTSICNLDIHDIARSARTFGVKKYYLITPEPSQQQLVARICGFWAQNPALMYNPDRSEALEIVECKDSIMDIVNTITTQEETRPQVITTTARTMASQMSFDEARTLLKSEHPVLILFGTGHGLLDDVHYSADHILCPIQGCGEYNHLSVRSAVAIVLDRLFSEDIHGRNNGYSANS